MKILWISYLLITIYAFILQGKTKKKKKLFIFLVIVQLTFLFAFRTLDVGVDLGRYWRTYERIRVGDIYTTIQQRENYENILYYISNYICSHLGMEYQTFLGIVGFGVTLPICITIYKYSKNLYLSVIVHLSFGIYAFQFSGLKQSIAMSLGVVAFNYLVNGNAFKFYLFVGIAMLFHPTAIVMLPLYAVSHMKLNKIRVFIMIGGIGIIVALRNYIGKLLTTIYADEYIGRYVSQNEIGGFAIVILIIGMIYLFGVSKGKWQKEDSLYLKILLITFVIQALASYAYSFTRINYYFIQFLPLIIVNIAELPIKYNWSQSKETCYLLSLAMKCGLILICTILYNSSIINGTNTFNYRFIWG